MNSGEEDLNKLLGNMQAVLNKGEYVFASLKSIDNIPRNLIISEFKEAEGISVIVEKSNAEKYGIPYTFVSAWISLEIHSSLNAVGLTAAVSTALAKAGISCNVVAAFYHDHIFVEKNKAKKAMQILNGLSALVDK